MVITAPTEVKIFYTMEMQIDPVSDRNDELISLYFFSLGASVRLGL